MWKSAFLLYLSTKNEDSIIKTDTKSKILDIKGQINNSRTSFVLPLSHKIEITPFWLLGFIEGEGWFHVKKQKSNYFSLIFGIGQTINQTPVIEAILKYLNNIATEKNLIHDIIRVKEYRDLRNKNSKPFVYLTFSRIAFILEVFIPFLVNLTFLSKKGLDYQDWREVAMLMKDGAHLTPEGYVIITNIRNRINNNRLSTNIKTL